MARLRSVAELSCFASPQSLSKTKAGIEGFSSPVRTAIRRIAEGLLIGLKDGIRALRP